MTNTNPPGTERPRYFHGQLLTAQDFADEQDYFREKLRRHNRLLHGWGVVCGLRVTPATKRCAVVVSPGYALDPCGDEILVEQEVLLRLPHRGREKGGDDFSAAGVEDPACPDGAWTVAVRYAEILAQLVPVIGEDDSPQPSRIRETFELRALPALSADHERDRKRRRSGDLDTCLPCPPDPEERWVVLAEVRVQSGRVMVHDLRPATGSRAPG